MGGHKLPHQHSNFPDTKWKMDCISMTLFFFFKSASLKLQLLGSRWPRITIRGAMSDKLELSGFYCLAQGQTAARVYPVSRLISGQAEPAPE